MSIIVGLVRKNTAWIGTDSKVNYADDACDVPKVGKFLAVWNGWLVACAGAERCSQAFANAAKKLTPPTSDDSMRSLADAIPAIFAAAKIRPVKNDDGVPYYDFEAIIAHGGSLWAITEDCSIERVERFCATGSGHAIATAAYKAIDKRLAPDVIVRRVIEIACEGNVFCGGHVHLRSTKPADRRKKR